MKVCVIFAYNRFDLFTLTLNIASNFCFDLIYVAIDGAADDAVFNEQTKMLKHLENIDDPRIKLIHESENKACKRQFMTVLTKIFSEHDFAVVLEDDCVPEQGFFEYCFEMKNKFENKDRIGIISGSNLLSYSDTGQNNYFISQTPNFWGWATWSKYWKLNDPFISISEIKNKYELSFVYNNLSHFENLYWREIFKHAYVSETIWDFLFTLALFSNNVQTVYPKKSLINNVGFDDRSTHTRKPQRFPKITSKHTVSDFSEHNSLVLKHIYGFTYLNLLKLKLGNTMRFVRH